MSDSSSALRETGERAYTDGRGTFHPPERRIERGAEITGERIVDVDACVIGSGAGGAPVAKELAEGGMTVAVLEDGEWHDTEDFTARPRDMTPRLYRDAGQITTLGNTPIVLPLGRGIGGTTLVNSGTCFRTPAPVLEHWQREFGLEALTPQELEPYFNRVERIINVAQVPARLAGANAAIVRRGAEALGWSGDYLFRNVRGCVGSGVCAFGCPTGAKQHTGITYVPRAWAAGATTFTGTRAVEVTQENGIAHEVIARTAGGGKLRVRARHFVVACGTVLTPGFLRAQGLGARSGELGRNLAIHPATGCQALMGERVDMWDGVPQSYFIDQFADEGIMFEGAAGPPDYMAMALHQAGTRHRELMDGFPQMSQFGVMVCDTSRGSVRRVAGRTQIVYSLNRRDTATFKRGIALLAQLYFAAGAREVIVPVAGVGPLRDGDIAPLRDARIRARDLMLMAFHPLGTARAGADPERSVIDPDLRVHGTENVYVADGSAVPSSLGVNPQITIMALATRLAFHLLEAPAPTHEPKPQRIADPKISVAHTTT